MSKLRLKVASLITQIIRNESSLASIPAIIGNNVQEKDQALFKEFCFGVCRYYFQLSAIANSLLQKPMRKKDADIYSLILIGLYQLFYMRTPAHAAINETVGSIKASWAKGLVNAILREAQRRYPEFPEKTPTQFNDDNCFLSNHPQWLLDSFSNDWPEYKDTIISGNNSRAPMTLRVNINKCSREDYLQLLADAGIPASKGSLAETSIVLTQAVSVTSLPCFSEGLVSVQDEASQLIPSMLSLEKNLNVLDACSAPGGKTCAMLEHEPSLRITALDNDKRRLARVEENLQRLKIPVSSTSLVCANAIETAQWWNGELFDRMLLDVPCSATGVIRRHPDIKMLRTPEQVSKLIEIQTALLSALWPLLAVNGILVYSTCSLLRDENDRQIENFCQQQTNCKVLPVSLSTGESLNYGHQLFPGDVNQDGFYYARLQKC